MIKMTSEAKRAIKNMSTSELVVLRIEDKHVYILVPYRTEELAVEVSGDTTEEQISSFVSEVNSILDDMIGHLEDVMLSYY